MFNFKTIGKFNGSTLTKYKPPRYRSILLQEIP